MQCEKYNIYIYQSLSDKIAKIVLKEQCNILG